jgi:hypothetical protein
MVDFNDKDWHMTDPTSRQSGRPKKQDSNFEKKNLWSNVPDLGLTPRHTDWLTVSRNVTLTWHNCTLFLLLPISCGLRSCFCYFRLSLHTYYVVCQCKFTSVSDFYFVAKYGEVSRSQMAITRKPSEILTWEDKFITQRVFWCSTSCECSSEVLCASVLVKYFVRVF